LLRSWVALRIGTPSAAMTRSPFRMPACSAGDFGTHFGDQRAFVALGVKGGRQFGREVLRADADAPAPHLAMGNDLLHDEMRHADRQGKSNADITAAGRQDCGVDADQLATQVHQRPARIARVDRGIGLDEILVAFDSKSAPAERAHDPRGDV
jgi:hypothetical protein